MAANGNHATRATGARCVALVGPFQSGKTTLLEAILARTGVIPRQGNVEAGTVVLNLNRDQSAAVRGGETDRAERGLAA